MLWVSCILVRGLSTDRADDCVDVSRLMGADYAAINFNGLVDAIEARSVDDMLMWY